MTTSATSPPVSVEFEVRRPQRSLWGDAWRRLIASTNGRLGLTISLVLLAIAIGGWLDTVAVWLMDILLAFPSTLLAIAIISASSSPASLSTRLGNAAAAIPILGDIVDPQLFNAMLAVAIVEIPVFGRIARATV